jgi:hypothetical protein
LFTYKSGGFSTHQKFGFIPDVINSNYNNNYNSNYIFESQLSSLMPIKNFHTCYENVKKRAAQYADDEAEGVAALYKYAPTAERRDERYFLVDIEIVFDSMNDIENNDDAKKTDRIDILLYDNQDRQLLFCEAKHYSNKEIKCETPDVVSQLCRYNSQIAANKDHIIKQYTTAFAEYNVLMGSTLTPPVSIYDKCGLYIFGFDRGKQAKLKKRLNGGLFYGHKCRFIGDTRNDNAEKVYRALI